MENLVNELKKQISFKETTDVGDIVIIASKKPQIILYALVTDIERDNSKRDEWWNVTFQALSVPPQKIVWTLRTDQMTGKEIFTMNGEERFVKAVNFSEKKPVQPKHEKKLTIKKKPVLKLVK